VLFSQNVLIFSRGRRYTLHGLGLGDPGEVDLADELGKGLGLEERASEERLSNFKMRLPLMLTSLCKPESACLSFSTPDTILYVGHLHSLVGGYPHEVRS
jgi:hypothetical protein